MIHNPWQKGYDLLVSNEIYSEVVPYSFDTCKYKSHNAYDQTLPATLPSTYLGDWSMDHSEVWTRGEIYPSIFQSLNEWWMELIEPEHRQGSNNFSPFMRSRKANQTYSEVQSLKLARLNDFWETHFLYYRRIFYKQQQNQWMSNLLYLLYWLAFRIPAPAEVPKQAISTWNILMNIWPLTAPTYATNEH